MKALLRRRQEIATVLLVVVGLLIVGGTFGPNPRIFVKSWIGQDVSNVLMFLPVGLLFPVRFKRWRWWTIPIGSATSALIEVLQLTVARHRDPELVDWVWNTVGTIVGFALWLGLREAWRRRSVWGSPQASR